MKCPNCRSTNITKPDTFMVFLYSIEPIECEDCGARFEPSVVVRLGLWLFVFFGLLADTFSTNILNYFGKEVFQIFIIIFMGTFFLSLFIGVILEQFRPWFYVLCIDSKFKRMLINYGCFWSVSVYGVYYVSQL